MSGSEPEPGILAEDLDPGRALVGVCIGLAGLLLLAEPVVEPVSVGGAPVPMFALSAVVLAVGLDLGAVVFYRNGRPTVAMAHGVAGAGWTLLVAGPVLGSGTVLVVGVLVVIGGALFLVSETRRWR